MKLFMRLTKKERLRVLIIAVSTLLALYTLVIYPRSFKAMQEAQNMVNRRLDRVEKRAKIKANRVESNPGLLAKELANLDQSIASAEASLATRLERFAPLDSTEALHNLRLEISTLAKHTGVWITHAREYDPTPKLAAQPTNLPTIGVAVNDFYRRPLFELDAEAGYWELLKFVDDLDALSAHVSVVRLRVAANPRPASNRSGESTNPELNASATPSDRLSINLLLTL